MRFEINGLVLRETPVGDNASYIDVLTAERGRKLITCHGSRKLSSKNLPATQPFCYSEFIVSKKNGRLTMKEVSLKESFFDLRCDLLDCALGSYMLELANECAAEEQDEKELLSLLLNSLFALCKKEHDRTLVKAAFELRLLQIEGSGPVYDACACCGGELTKEFYFSPAEGGTVCAHCKAAGGAGLCLPFDEGAQKALSYVLTCPQKRLFSFKLGEKSARLLEKAAREADSGKRIDGRSTFVPE